MAQALLARDSMREVLHFPTIFISDTHLGKPIARADMLLEFLENTTCDTLVINGDGIDGWYLESHKYREFPEMHARVIDAINAKAARGTRVVYIAGNHDEKLRGVWNRAQRAVKPPKHSSKKSKKRRIFNRPYTFQDPTNGHSFDIELRKGLHFTDPQGRRLVVIHGDQFDTDMFKTAFGKAVSRYVGDPLYDGLVVTNAAMARLQALLPKKNKWRYFSIAAYLKGKTKKTVGIIENFEKAVAKTAKSKKFDGAICGHIHHAEIVEKKKSFYANSGDWVEGCTAFVYGEDGQPEIIRWADKREELGLVDTPTINDSNPNAQFRSVTEKQLRWFRRLWPSSKHDNKQKKSAPTPQPV